MNTDRLCVACVRMRLLLLVLSLLYWRLAEVHSQAVVISRSHNDTVYIGTQLTLTAHISLGGVNSVDVTWTRGNDVIVNESHTIVSVVSGSGSSYMSSLSFSPITSCDGGPITATVTATVTATSLAVNASDTHILRVTGTVATRETCFQSCSSTFSPQANGDSICTRRKAGASVWV